MFQDGQTLLSPPLDSATDTNLKQDSSTQAALARASALSLTSNTTLKLSSPGSSPTSSSEAQASNKNMHEQTGGEEDEKAEAPDLAKAMADILDFPEDLEGPNNPKLLAVMEPASFDSNAQLQGMVAASSRLFRPAGK